MPQKVYSGVVVDPDIVPGGAQDMISAAITQHENASVDDIAQTLMSQVKLVDDIPEYTPSDGDEEVEEEKEVGENDQIDSMSSGSAGSYAARLLALSEEKRIAEVKKRMEDAFHMVKIFYLCCEFFINLLNALTANGN